MLTRCTTNSSGTRLRASSPRIISRGIQPPTQTPSSSSLPSSSFSSESQGKCIASSQLPMTWMLSAGCHWLMSIWWKPSSHRKPRGKTLREGVAVNKLTGGARSRSAVERGPAPCCRRVTPFSASASTSAAPPTAGHPWKCPIPPSTELRHTLAASASSGVNRYSSRSAGSSSAAAVPPAVLPRSPCPLSPFFIVVFHRLLLLPSTTPFRNTDANFSSNSEEYLVAKLSTSSRMQSPIPQSLSPPPAAPAFGSNNSLLRSWSMAELVRATEFPAAAPSIVTISSEADS
mmetsp:Transcript_27183/g.45569  ORF Transcript_27183/g.45569 Transcript_27183/m.45569 type:complete len:288 (+) Transcript_27183:1660-2523(+)